MSEEEVATERNTLLVDSDVQTLIQHMVGEGKYVISPQINADGISYPMLSVVFANKTEAEIAAVLQKLTSSGLLKSSLYDKVIVCPACGSPQVHSKYNCPRCDSFDIGKAPVIEHARCGYIGSKEKFSKGNLLICPKCKNTVGEEEYKKIGTSFECNSCGSRFETPRISHKCNSCKDVFTYRDAKYEPIRGYELTEEAKRNVAKGTLPLKSIIATLKENGFEVILRGSLIGKSGATHNFDLIAKRYGSLVVANFAFEPKEEEIIGLFAKKYDVNPTYTVLISLSPPSTEEDAVSKAYDVRIMNPSSVQSIGKQLTDLMTKDDKKDERQVRMMNENIEPNKSLPQNTKHRNPEYSFDQEWDQYNF